MARLVEGFTDDYKQQFQLTIGQPGDNYASADILMSYSVPRNCWYIDITWDDFEMKGLKLSNSRNMLRDFRSLIPFGLLVTGGNGSDPMLVDSFVNTHEMYLLDQNEAATLS